jgi:osmotically-inducible protein OsmY
MRRFFVALAMVATMLAPLCASADDRLIAEQIIRSLKLRKDAGELKGFNLDLKVDGGAVWLKGYVSKPEQQRIAVDIARRVEGVEKVFTDIEVRGLSRNQTEAQPTANRAALLGSQEALAIEPQESVTRLASSEELVDGEDNSRQIAQALVKKLRAEQDKGNLRGFGIDVQVEEGVLWLKGTVASEEQRHLILEIARRIRGVKKVVNEISIKESAPTPIEAVEIEEQPETSARRRQEQPIPVDVPAVEEINKEVIASEVTSRLKTQQKLGALRDFGIDVQVDEGVVWMSGYVASAEQQALALDMARYVPGVKQVVNDLAITEAVEAVVDVEAEPTELTQPVEKFVSQPMVPAELPSQPEPMALRSEPQVIGSALRVHPEASPSPLRPQPQPVAQPVAQPQARQYSQAPQYTQAPQYSYVPTSPQSHVVGYALVNVGGNQPQQQQPQSAVQPVSNQLQMPRPFAPARPVQYMQGQSGQPMPMMGAQGVGIAPARYDSPQLPGYAWPSYSAHPNYGALTYPRQYSAQAWPYIGPFYPYPQVPLGWRKVTLEWDDGWWHLDFKDRH